MNGWVYEAGHLYELMNLLFSAMHEWIDEVGQWNELMNLLFSGMKWMRL